MGVATIGSALVEKRLELGLDKGQAAEVIGMSRTTYSSYEQDAQRPSVDVFVALAEFLKISIDDFFSLYGATCVAAARASYERSVGKAPAESVVSPDPGVSSLTTEDTEAENESDDVGDTLIQGAVTTETSEDVEADNESDDTTKQGIVEAVIPEVTRDDESNDSDDTINEESVVEAAEETMDEVLDNPTTQGVTGDNDAGQPIVSEVGLELSEEPVMQTDTDEAEETAHTTLSPVVSESSPSATESVYSSDVKHPGHKKKKKKKKK
jgi:transcriptional regulator with XRE-family HTH domain